MSDDALPIEVRKACLLLRIPEDKLTKNNVLDTWKREIIEVHPAKGGEPASAIILNRAKETLLEYLAVGNNTQFGRLH